MKIKLINPELFFNSATSREGDFYIDGKFIMKVECKDGDDWFGFEIGGSEYDLNVWEDEGEHATIYSVVNGNTQTSGDMMDVKITRNNLIMI